MKCQECGKEGAKLRHYTPLLSMWLCDECDDER